MRGLQFAECVLAKAPAESRYRAKYEKYMVAEAAWKDARDLRKLEILHGRGFCIHGYCGNVRSSDFSPHWSAV